MSSDKIKQNEAPRLLVFDVDALMSTKADKYFKEFLHAYAKEHNVHCAYLFNIYLFLSSYEAQAERTYLLESFYELHFRKRNIAGEQLSSFVSAELLECLRDTLAKSVYDRELFDAVRALIKHKLDEHYMPLFLSSVYFKNYRNEKRAIDLSKYENVPANDESIDGEPQTPPPPPPPARVIAKQTAAAAYNKSTSSISTMSSASSVRSAIVAGSKQKRPPQRGGVNSSTLSASANDLTLRDRDKTLVQQQQKKKASNKSMSTDEMAANISVTNPLLFASQVVDKLEKLSLKDEKRKPTSSTIKSLANTSTRSLLVSASAKLQPEPHADSILDKHMDRLNATKASSRHHHQHHSSSKHHHKVKLTTTLPATASLPFDTAQSSPRTPFNHHQALDSGLSTRTVSNDRVCDWICEQHNQQPPVYDESHQHHHKHKSHHKHHQHHQEPLQMPVQPTGKTQIVYMMPGETVPYLSTHAGAAPLTLATFKKLINKRGHFRYFFMTKMDDLFGTGAGAQTVKEEISDDNAVLPKFGEKVIAEIVHVS